MATQADYNRLGAWAALLNPDRNIDRRHNKRVVPMEVLSLGPSRTGTFSMQEALSILGYPDPYHFYQVATNVKDADLWAELFAKKNNSKGRVEYRKEFDAILGHCGAVTDAPCFVFWRELIDTYPDAKVVLVKRDEDKWLVSMKGLIDGTLNPFGIYVLRWTDPTWFGRIINTGVRWIGGFLGTTDKKEIQRVAKQKFREHYAAVRAAVPEGRLLEFELSSGWEPLCKFLQKPVPDVPFPHRNEAAALEAAFQVVILTALKRSAMNIAIAVGVGAVLAGTIWRLFR